MDIFVVLAFIGALWFDAMDLFGGDKFAPTALMLQASQWWLTKITRGVFNMQQKCTNCSQ